MEEVVKREIGNPTTVEVTQSTGGKSDKRVYLKKKAIKYGFGENNTIINRWVEEWQQTGKVSYS